MQTTSLKRSHSNYNLLDEKDPKKLKYDEKICKSPPSMFSGAYLIQKFDNTDHDVISSKHSDQLFRYLVYF